MNTLDTGPIVPRWLHVWSVLTALAALPLVTLGAEVTTKNVGMIDHKGFREPWHLATVSLPEKGLGFLIEHGHRLAGFVVGTCCIVLAVGLWFGARRQPYRSLGLVALLAVTAQGLLGIFRVNKHDVMGPSLALVHGCFAQLTFAVLVAVAVLTSRSWFTVTVAGARQWRWLAIALSALVYVQIIFGATVRHLYDRLAQRAHILLAFAVVVLAAWLIKAIWDAGPDRVARRVAMFLAVLLCVQPVLGVEAWLRRFGAMTAPFLIHSSPTLDLVRSGHHVIGTLLFSTTVALALLLHRSALSRAALPTPEPAPLEGAA
jgi:cytochrome c oxidase assembly protein subunit 15